MKRIAAALVVVACLLAGCGSGGGTTGATTTASTISAAAAKQQKGEADAICTRMIAEAHRLGRKALAAGVGEYDNTLEFTTDGLIAPALPVVERSVRELRAVTTEAGEPQLDGYVAMWDPILSLLIERVQAGRQGEGEQAHQIEEQLIELAGIQKDLAKEAGLKVCTVNLIDSFTSSPPA
jgi:outer membrane murein-binding lipoprotein Lpp